MAVDKEAAPHVAPIGRLARGEDPAAGAPTGEIPGRGAGQRLTKLVVYGLLLSLAFLYFIPFGWVYQTYFRVSGGLAVPYSAILLVLIAISILSNIPISVNVIGLREQLHYLLFGSLGISKELAVGISLIIFSQFLILSVLGGLVWLRLRGRATLTGVAGTR